MTRFKTFIVEDAGFRSQKNGDQFNLETLKEECAPFIAQRKHTTPLWRGIGRIFSAGVGYWGRIDVQRDRRPKDLHRKAHTATDNFFMKHSAGAPARRGSSAPAARACRWLWSRLRDISSWPIQAAVLRLDQ